MISFENYKKLDNILINILIILFIQFLIKKKNGNIRRKGHAYRCFLCFFLIVLSFAYLFLNKMDDALSFRNKIPNTYHKFGSKTKN
jgi:hypothetical protein